MKGQIRAIFLNFYFLNFIILVRELSYLSDDKILGKILRMLMEFEFNGVIFTVCLIKKLIVAVDQIC